MKLKPFERVIAPTLLAFALVLGQAQNHQGDAASPRIADGDIGGKAGALTLERISREPDTQKTASTIKWSPDSHAIAWLELVEPASRGKITPQNQLWAVFPPASTSPAAAPGTAGKDTNKPRLLISAKDATALLGKAESTAIASEDEENAADPAFFRDFAWSPDGSALLLVGSQSLSWFEIKSGRSHILTKGANPIQEAAISPDGKSVTFIRKHILNILEIRPDISGSNHPRPLLPAPKDGIFQAELDWPYREEFHLSRGYQWSPDSSRVAYMRIDDRAVARQSIQRSNGQSTEIVYPRPGADLPLVTILVKSVHAPAGQAAVELNLGSTRNFYFPRMLWLPDGRHLAIERLDRRQQKLDLMIADVVTGKTRTALSEQDPYWINISNDLKFLSDGKRFLWSSQRDNYRHLYLYSLEGKLLSQLTTGNWESTEISGIDEAKSLVYFTATARSPLERHLYSVRLDGSQMSQETTLAGTHRSFLAPNGATIADLFSNQGTAPRLLFTSVRKTAPPTAPASDPNEASTDPPFYPAPAGLQPVEMQPFQLHLGANTHSLMIKPPNFDPGKKYPTIVYLAGGPGEQLVQDAWAGAAGLWMQWMAQKGYILFALDNQGTANRGHYFEEPIHLRLGGQEMGDQREGLLYLRTLPFVDQSRLGVAGWGYGGFLAVHAMLDRPVPYKAGFAGAPVIDWHNYDAIFAERYLDDPVAHADGWDASSALENRSANFFSGPLLVAQGTSDEFVSMKNLLTLEDELVDQGKSADVLLLPNRGHQPEDSKARLALYTRMTDFFIKNL